MSWPTVALKEESSLITKGTTPTSLGHQYSDHGVPFLRAQNLVDGTISVAADPLYISEETNKVLKRSIIQPNDVLISIAGTIGRAAIVPSDAGEMNCNQAVAIVRPSEKINRRFLLHWLSSQDAMSQVSKGKVTGVISNLSLGQIGQLKIPLLPLDEQQRIATILDQADALRRLRQRANDRLNYLGEAIFHEMFGDPTDNPKQGLNWQTEPLDESIHFIDYRGKTPPKTATGVPLITAKNVKMGFIRRDPQEYIDASAYDTWMNRGFPKKGDILFTTEAPLGNVAELNTAEKLVVGQRLLTLQPVESKIDPIFLMYFLMSQGFRKLMLENSTGSTVVGIKSKLLKKIPISYPEIDYQVRFREKIKQLEHLQKFAQEHAISSDALSSSLQQRAFQGEL